MPPKHLSMGIMKFTVLLNPSLAIITLYLKCLFDAQE